MRKLKELMVYIGLLLFVVAGMLALPGQETLTLLVVVMGAISFASVGLIEYLEDRR